MTLSGTETQIDAALATLNYQGNLNYIGSDTLTVLSTDSGALIDSDTIPISVQNPNEDDWTNPSGGAWTTTGNWSTGQLPTSTTAAVLNAAGTYTVTSSGNVTIDTLISIPTATLSITAGTFTVTNFTGQGPLALSGGTFNINNSNATVATLTQTGGTLKGTGTLTVGTAAFSSGGGTESGILVSGLPVGTTVVQGTATINTGGNNLSMTIDSRTLQLQGATSLIGTSGGFFNLNDAAHLVITSSGTVNDQSNGLAINTNTLTTSLINNQGSWTRNYNGVIGANSNLTTATTINVAFNNSGTVDVEAGTVKLAGGGSDSGGSYIGPGTVEFGQVSGGTVTHTVNGSINAGNVTFSGGTNTVSGSYSVSGTTTISGGTSTLSGTISGLGALAISAGTLDLSSTSTTAISLTQTGGTLKGTGTLTVGTAAFSSGGGTESGILVSGLPVGTTVVQGTATINTGGNNLSMTINSRTLQLQGATSLIGTSGGFFNLNDAAHLVITSSGTVNDQSNGLAINTNTLTTSLINNQGSWTRNYNGVIGANSNLTTATTINVAFNNSGTVDVEAGTVKLAGGGSDSGGSYIGPGTVEFGQVSGGTVTHTVNGSINAGNVTFSGGTNTVSGSYSVSGTTTISGGTSTLSGTISGLGALAISAGTLDLSSTSTTAISLTQTGGTLKGTGTLTVGTAAFSSGGGTESGILVSGLPVGTTVVQGTATINTGGNNLSMTIDSRTLQLQGATSLIGTSGGFFNLNDAAHLVITSSGTVNDQSNGLAINTNTLTTSLINNQGSWTRNYNGVIGANSNLTTATTINVAFNNSGTVDVKAGTMVFGGTVTNSGTLHADGGIIKINNAVTDTGNALIDGSTLEYVQGSTEHVTFGSATGGTLKLDNSPLFNGTVAGFRAQETIDLTNISFLNSSQASYNPTTGTLTVSDSTPAHTANIVLQGSYQNSQFTTADDGSGHVKVVVEVAPTITGDLAISVINGGSVVLTKSDFQAVDPDNTASQVTFIVTNPTHGYVAFGNAPATAITSFTEADLEAGNVVFVHDGSATSEATFQVAASDGIRTSTPTTIVASVPNVAINVVTTNGIDFQSDNPIIAIGSGAVQPGSASPSTTFTIVNLAANRDFVFQGTQFSYDAANGNALTAGTILAFQELTHDTQTPLVDFSGHIKATDFYNASVQQSDGVPNAFDALSSQWMILFTGGGGNDAFGAGDANDAFKASGGNDFFDGQFGLDRAIYTAAVDPIDVALAAGVVTKYADTTKTTIAGTDTLQSIELVTGTEFADNFNASGFSASTPNAGSTVSSTNGTLNEFEGRSGDDTITGNGNTRVSYLHATGPVTVNLATGAIGDASVGHDTFNGGVNGVRGSEFGDALIGTNNPANTVEVFEGRGGDDTISAGGGFDRAIYYNEDFPITVHLASGKVVGGPNTGIDTLLSVESVGGTDFNDTYTAAVDSDPTYGSALAFGAAGAANVGSLGTFNEFEGGDGNDQITGNGNTRIAFYNATEGVTVVLSAGGAGTSESRAVFSLVPYIQAHDPTADPADVGVDTIVSGVSQVRGSAFADNITGNGGNNGLEGQAGDDTLSGNGGVDTLTGGSGADRFVFTSGTTTITDFDQGDGAFNQGEADRIDLRNAGVGSFGALGLSQDVNNNSIVTTSAGNTITVQGVPNAQLHDYDFIFTGQVTINVLTSNGFDFSNLYTDFANINPALTAHDNTHYVFADPTDGLIFTLVSNAGFTYDGNGNPTGGTVNNLGIFDLSYGNVSALNGSNFSLTNFLSAVNTYSTSHDPTALDAIFFNNPSIHYNAVGSSQVADNNGNTGGDTFISSVNNDVFDGRTNANGDNIGGDTVDYSHTPGPNGVTVNLGLSGVQQNTVGSGLDELLNVENLRGSNFGDTLTGDGNSNILEGGPGNDTLNGGGGGNDTASYEHASIGVTVDLTISGPQNTGTSTGTDTVINIENLRGSAFNDTLTGNGNSTLEGGPGADHLIGQSGLQDTASYEHASTGVAVNLANPVLNTGDAAGDTFTFINNVRGSNFNDKITGNNNANVLDGGYGGSDQLTGLGGSDTFVFHGNKLTITDFNQGGGTFNPSEGDHIDVTGLHNGTGVTAVEFDAVVAASSGSELNFGNGNVIELPGVDVHQLILTNNFIHS